MDMATASVCYSNNLWLDAPAQVATTLRKSASHQTTHFEISTAN